MYYNLAAVILKRENLKEDDLIITVYSRQRGKAILQAKGAKKIKSKLAGHLEPVSLSNLDVTIGKNIDHLIGADIIESYAKIKSDLELTAYASYFIELVNKLTKENEPDKKIFNLFVKSLDYLKNKGDNLKIARISFGYKLSHLLGFSPAEKGILKDEIEYIVTQPVAHIINHSSINKNLPKLNKLLDQELENFLEAELNTKQFFKALHVRNSNTIK